MKCIKHSTFAWGPPSTWQKWNFCQRCKFLHFHSFFVFFLTKTVKLGEIDGVKFLAWKSGGVKFWTISMSEPRPDQICAGGEEGKGFCAVSAPIVKLVNCENLCFRGILVALFTWSMLSRAQSSLPILTTPSLGTCWVSSPLESVATESQGFSPGDQFVFYI